MAIIKEQEDAMTRLMYFAFNFPMASQWIPRVWGEGSDLTRHFTQKWNWKHIKNQDPTAGFMDFLSDLSDGNKAMLYDYILNEWKG